MAAPRELDPVFAPNSIAVVGASRDPKSVGATIFANLINGGFPGPVFAINPKATEIQGKPCYPSFDALPAPVDLAVFCIPAASVTPTLAKAGERGAKAAVIISAGFAELGAEGKAREKELADTARAVGIAVIGPNCLGVINTSKNLNATFAKEPAKPGSIAFVSQSGAVAAAILDYAIERNIGFSVFASLGNKADVDEQAMLTYLANDPATKVIAVYTEHLSDAAGFINATRSLANGTPPKPVIVLKAGASTAGSKAAMSHTGAVAGSAEAYAVMFRQANAVVARSVEELLDFATVFTQNPIPSSRSLAVITNAGGPGILAADTAELSGLSLTGLPYETLSKLERVIPPTVRVGNPIDLLGDAGSDRYEQALATVMGDPSFGSVLTIVTPQTMTDSPGIARALVSAAKTYNKPVVASFMGSASMKEAHAILSEAGVSQNLFPETATRMLAAMASFATGMSRERGGPYPPVACADRATVDASLTRPLSGRTSVATHRALDVVSAYGIPVPSYQFITSVEQAADAAIAIGKPLAIKVVSADIVHKSDVGGVELGIDPKYAERVVRSMAARLAKKCPQARIEGYLLMEMVTLTGGTELIVGSKEEPGLGKLVLVGAGGIWVELYRDVSMRFLPLDKTDASDMIGECRIAKVLAGFRGSPPGDVRALTDVIGRVAALVTDHPEIVELDINPLVVFPEGKGVVAVDARIAVSA